jgi:hypothetical protein
VGRRRASVLVGAGIVASRFVVAEVPALTLTMLRYAIGFACLLPFALPALPGALAVLRTRDAIALIAAGLWLATRLQPGKAAGAPG